MKTLELITSSLCNLNCVYCYRDNNIEEHERILNWSSSLVDDVEKHHELFKDIDQISLWGGEPTTSIHAFIEPLKKLLQRYTNVKKVLISTNFTNIEPFIPLIEALLDVDVIITFQISIDGPNNIMLQSRGILVETIFDNIKKIHELFKNTKIDYLTKATWGSETLELLSDYPQLVDEYYSFMEDLKDYYKLISYSDTTSGYFKMSNKAFYVIPHTYSVKDGMNFKKVMEESVKLKKEKPSIMIPFQFTIDVMANEYHYGTGKCSGGTTTYACSKDGLAGCHRSAIYNEPPFLVYDINKSRYIIEGFKLFDKFRFKAIQILINELALSGQIRREYLKKEKALIFSKFIASSVSCHVENYRSNGSMFLTSNGLIRLLGQFDLISLLEEYKYCRGN